MRAAQLAIQERDWKRKKAELKRRKEVVGGLNVQARVTEQLVQSATKKLKDRLRELHSVFLVCCAHRHYNCILWNDCYLLCVSPRACAELFVDSLPWCLLVGVVDV